MMKFGHFSDKSIPQAHLPDHEFAGLYHLNSNGYRCPEWTPMPDGKKNVAIFGCSHSYGQGLAEDEHWVFFLSQHNKKRLRYWNLSQPGSSADKIVRTLYGADKVIHPKIIIVCWPDYSRRERLETYPIDLRGSDENLRYENAETDKQNFLKNVFFVEKYAEINQCKTFHCFAQESYHELVGTLNVLPDQTIANCWPHWDKTKPMGKNNTPSVARDGRHYGVEHHKRFAQLFLDRFATKLK